MVYGATILLSPATKKFLGSTFQVDAVMRFSEAMAAKRNAAC